MGLELALFYVLAAVAVVPRNAMPKSAIHC